MQMLGRCASCEAERDPSNFYSLVLFKTIAMQIKGEDAKLNIIARTNTITYPSDPPLQTT